MEAGIFSEAPRECGDQRLRRMAKLHQPCREINLLLPVEHLE
jgi:hypothetical protein